MGSVADHVAVPAVTLGGFRLRIFGYTELKPYMLGFCRQNKGTRTRPPPLHGFSPDANTRHVISQTCFRRKIEAECLSASKLLSQVNMHAKYYGSMLHRCDVFELQ
jgi:hypothetical protein